MRENDNNNRNLFTRFIESIRNTPNHEILSYGCITIGSTLIYLSIDSAINRFSDNSESNNSTFPGSYIAATIGLILIDLGFLINNEHSNDLNNNAPILSNSFTNQAFAVAAFGALSLTTAGHIDSSVAENSSMNNLRFLFLSAMQAILMLNSNELANQNAIIPNTNTTDIELGILPHFSIEQITYTQQLQNQQNNNTAQESSYRQ